MAITDKEQGVWELEGVYNKSMEGYWNYSAPDDPGNLFSWGYGSAGQLGLNSRTNYSSPVLLSGGWDSVYAFASGEGSSGGVKTDGTLWVWGFNNNGLSGQNYSSPNRISSPVQIPGTTWSSAAKSMRTGNYHTAALKTNGTLWTWGSNSEGQLGQNNATSYSSPTQVGTDTTWALGEMKFAMGAGKKMMAIKTNGTLWTWGTQDYGGLGHNQANQTYSSPKQVGTDTTWSKITQWGGGGLAIKTDGTLWSWGSGDYGAHGHNNRTNYSSPKQLGTATNWTQVNATSAGVMKALNSSGELWSWGYNSFGFAGTNVSVHLSSPTQVGTDTTWANIQGCSGSLARVTKTDGTLWLWGRNSFGGAIAGANSNQHRSSPVQTPGTNWGTIGGTNYGVMALTT